MVAAEGREGAALRGKAEFKTEVRQTGCHAGKAGRKVEQPSGAEGGGVHKRTSKSGALPVLLRIPAAASLSLDKGTLG